MRFLLSFFSFFILTTSCSQKKDHLVTDTDQYVISFGSCDNQHIENKMWNDILKNEPNIFIWGGDIVYSDTEDMDLMQKNYSIQKTDSLYTSFSDKVMIMGTWDDHDYGVNDGGFEFSKKDSVQQLLLDFLDVDKKDPRRTQQGVYTVKNIELNSYQIKIFILDTRYFRTPLTKDNESKKRYKPNTYGEGTILGETQWHWLEKELSQSKADFNIIMSSIQFLSNEHGFETWGNMPHEVEKLENIISNSNAKGVIILSGDRHIAEISAKKIKDLDYPLIDFTSSGMTHSYSSFSGEANPFRVSKVTSGKNFGILKFDLKTKNVTMEIRGENNQLFEQFVQQY